MIAGVDSPVGVPRIVLRAAARLAVVVTVSATTTMGCAVGRAGAQSTTATSTPAARAPGRGGMAVGPGISVKDARRTQVRGPVLVSGYLLAVPDEALRLCDALNHSRPPQCVGAFLKIRGLSSRERNRLATEHRSGSTARWSPGAVQILGKLRESTLVVQTTAKA